MRTGRIATLRVGVAHGADVKLNIRPQLTPSEGEAALKIAAHTLKLCATLTEVLQRDKSAADLLWETSLKGLSRKKILWP